MKSKWTTRKLCVEENSLASKENIEESYNAVKEDLCSKLNVVDTYQH